MRASSLSSLPSVEVFFSTPVLLPIGRIFTEDSSESFDSFATVVRPLGLPIYACRAAVPQLPDEGELLASPRLRSRADQGNKDLIFDLEKPFVLYLRYLLFKNPKPSVRFYLRKIFTEGSNEDFLTNFTSYSDT